MRYDEFPEAIEWQSQRIKLRWFGCKRYSGDEEASSPGTLGILQMPETGRNASIGSCVASAGGEK